MVKILNNDYDKAGKLSLTWNANEFMSGLYILRFEADNYIETIKKFIKKILFKKSLRMASNISTNNKQR